MPRVSWLVPIYNAAPYLRLALASIEAQTYRDFEVIVVDDGSRDDSAAIIDHFCKRDPRFRYFYKTNSGIVDALNKGLEHCSGEYVARMDGDDICEPHRLERQVAYLDLNPDCVVVGSRVTVIDPAGELIRRTTGESWRKPGPEGFPPGGIALTHPSILGRTSKFRQVGGYRHGFMAAEDYDLWFRLHHVGRLTELPEHLLRYRVHPNSESATKILQQRFSCLKAEVADFAITLPVDSPSQQRILECTKPEELFEAAGALDQNLPGPDVLRTYYFAEYLRRATYRLPPAEARRIAGTAARHAARLIPRARSAETRFFLVKAAKEILRWAAVSAIGRNRQVARPARRQTHFG